MAKHQQITENKSFKKELFETLYTRLDNSVIEYKEVLGEKKLNRFLKRTSKELAGQINKATKQARKRQKRSEKKQFSKPKKKKEVRA